jgi:2-hydroxychromene-2-carboxylate isomerase
MPVVEFYFDFRSPYSYLAHSQLESLKATIQYRPIDVLAVMEQVGNTPTTLTCRAKGRYARADLQRWAKQYAIAVRSHPDIAKINNQRLLQAVLVANETGQTQAVVSAIFNAYWSSVAPLATLDDLAAVLNAPGIDATEIIALVDAPDHKMELIRASQFAAEIGVFGAPTFIAGGEMFFGNDRLDFLRNHLEQLS